MAFVYGRRSIIDLYRAPQAGEPSFLPLDERPGNILIQDRDLRHTVRELNGIGQIPGIKLPFPDRACALVVVAQAEEVLSSPHCFQLAELGEGHFRPLHRDRQLFGQQLLGHIRARHNGALRVRHNLAIGVLDTGHIRRFGERYAIYGVNHKRHTFTLMYPARLPSLNTGLATTRPTF